MYERLRDEMVLDLDGASCGCGERRRAFRQALAARLGAIYDEHGDVIAGVHDRKLDALEALVEAANGQPLLVAYWFKHDLQRIRQRFPRPGSSKTSSDIKAWNARQIPGSR